MLQARYAACAARAAAKAPADKPQTTFDALFERARQTAQHYPEGASTLAVCGSVGDFTSLHSTFEAMALQSSGPRVISSARREPVPLPPRVSETASAFVQHSGAAAAFSREGSRGRAWKAVPAQGSSGECFVAHLEVADSAPAAPTFGARPGGAQAAPIPARRLRWGAQVDGLMLPAGHSMACHWLHGPDGRGREATRPISHPSANPQNMSDRHRVGHADPRFRYAGPERGEWNAHGPLDQLRLAQAWHSGTYGALDTPAGSELQLEGAVALTRGDGPVCHADALEAARRGARALVHLRSAQHSVSRPGMVEAEEGGEDHEMTPMDGWVSIVVLEVRGRAAMRLHECACRALHLLRLTVSQHSSAPHPFRRDLMARAAMEAAAAPVPTVTNGTAPPPVYRAPPVLPDLLAVPMPGEPEEPRPATSRLKNPPTIFADGRPAAPKGPSPPTGVWFWDGMRPGAYYCDSKAAAAQAQERRVARWQTHALG